MKSRSTRTESLNRFVDRQFDKLNPYLGWLATAAIVYLLLRVIYSAITGH